jgi:hypothetical protein
MWIEILKDTRRFELVITNRGKGLVVSCFTLKRLKRVSS